MTIYSCQYTNIQYTKYNIQSSPTLWDPMNCSMPGFPVLPYLLEFAQTHVHWVSDVIQPSYPLIGKKGKKRLVCKNGHHSIIFWDLWSASLNINYETWIILEYYSTIHHLFTPWVVLEWSCARQCVRPLEACFQRLIKETQCLEAWTIELTWVLIWFCHFLMCVLLSVPGSFHLLKLNNKGT